MTYTTVEAYALYRTADAAKTVKVFGPKDEGRAVYKYLRDGKPFGALIGTTDAKFIAKFPVKVAAL